MMKAIFALGPALIAAPVLLAGDDPASGSSDHETASPYGDVNSRYLVTNVLS